MEPVQGEYDEGEMDNIYNISSEMDDYVNMIIDGMLSWWSVISCSSDSSEALKNW